jgi:hypothetical protein
VNWKGIVSASVSAVAHRSYTTHKCDGDRASCENQGVVGCRPCPGKEKLSTTTMKFVQYLSNLSRSALYAIVSYTRPKCKEPLLGPLPVYKKNGSPRSYLFNMRSKSRWEKKRPRRSQRCLCVEVMIKSQRKLWWLLAVSCRSIAQISRAAVH